MIVPGDLTMSGDRRDLRLLLGACSVNVAWMPSHVAKEDRTHALVSTRGRKSAWFAVLWGMQRQTAICTHDGRKPQ